MKAKINKADALKKLNELLVLAGKEDAAALKQFKKDCHAEYMEFLALCRKACKWSFDEFKKNHGRVTIKCEGTSGRYDKDLVSLRCPSTVKPRIQRAIEILTFLAEDRKGDVSLNRDDPILNVMIWKPKHLELPASLCELAST